MSSTATIIAIGGSSGSIPILIKIIDALPENYTIPLMLVVHRMKNVDSELKRILSATRNIVEPEDKSRIQSGCIYLAPQNYHLLVEGDGTFSLDYSEPVNYSRPSIDVTFESIADTYGKNAVGILLSGANKDGANGIAAMLARGGRGIIQHPDTADYKIMPEAAAMINTGAEIQSPENIVNTLLSLKY